MRKLASFTDFKKVRNLSFNDFNRWVISVYQSGFEDGKAENVPENDISEDLVASMDTERFVEVVKSVPGIDQRHAEMILEAVLAEGNSYFDEK